MTIEYRQAASEDADLLIGIYNASFHDDFLRYGMCPGYGLTKELMEESMIRHPKHIILCDHEPVGCVSYTKLDMGVYEVTCLCIVPEYQGKGIGTRAIQFLKTVLEDWKRLTLVTPMDKEENVRFYTEKCGFHIVSTEMDGSIRLARFALERQLPHCTPALNLQQRGEQDGEDIHAKRGPAAQDQLSDLCGHL